MTNAFRFTCSGLAMVVAAGLILSADIQTPTPVPVPTRIAPGTLTLPFDIQAGITIDPESGGMVVVMKNLGPGRSPEVRFRLYRYDRTGGGAGSAIGGTGNVQTVPPLNRNEMKQFYFANSTLGLTRGVSNVFKLTYSSPLNDRDNSNHRPEFRVGG